MPNEHHSTWPETTASGPPRLSDAWYVQRVKELEAALRPFANYAEKRDAKPLRGIGDSIHCIHTGTEYEAEITLTHCRHARQILLMR
jgi:hypothetical protein